MVRRCELHPDATGIFIFGSNNGLGEPKGFELAAQQSMEADFCVTALKEALAKYGKPGIFNTDQGSQFTSIEFTQTLLNAGVKISMDGKGRWVDNVMVERLWRSLKYDCVYRYAFETGSEARNGIGEWIKQYNEERPHSSLDDRTPHEAYWNLPKAGCPGKLAA